MDTGIASVALWGPIVSAVIQLFKDHVRGSDKALPWISPIVGALLGAYIGYANGASGTSQLLTIAIGLLAVPGTHSVAFQDKLPGQVLKAVGTALINSIRTSPPAN